MSLVMKKILHPLLLCLVCASISAAVPAGVERPRQPFIPDLLARHRGEWHFNSAIGETITHSGTVSVFSPTAARGNVTRIALLLDDPEFPGDNARAVWKTVSPGADGSFAIIDPGFSMKLTLDGAPGKTLRGTLSEIRLNGAPRISGTLAGLYADDGTRYLPLLPGVVAAPRIESAAFAGTFTENEPVRLYFSAPSGTGELIVEDLYRKKEISRQPATFTGEEQSITLDLKKFGCFDVKLVPNQGESASCRIVRIPEPLPIDPQKSFMGMNIFQQQLWYHTYQLPLFAKAGIRWIRPWLHWENTWKMQEPRSGEFNTQPLDALLRRLKAHDQKFEYILYNFSPTLGLASTELSALNASQMERWLDYVRKIVTHCGDQVNDYEIWNEPDLLALKNAEFSARFYADLVRKSAAAIREVKPAASIHTMSHSSFFSWLEEFCNQPGMVEATDVVTLHTYAMPLDFASRETTRMELLDRSGFRKQPRYFNEIGHSGYDGCATYSAAFPIATERNQADSVAVNYAQSLYFGNGDGKVFWFCSLDPRNSSDPAQHTSDSGYGMLYLGGEPKVALPALAATGKMLDGRKLLGRLEPMRDIILLPFEGDRAVLYHRGDRKEISALELGCVPGEKLTVYDLFGNPVDSGDAATLKIDLTDGPRFLDGGKTWSKEAAINYHKWQQQRELTARAESEVPPARFITLAKNDNTQIILPLPEGAEPTLSVSENAPFTVARSDRDGKLICNLSALDRSGHGTLLVTIRLSEPELPIIRRAYPVSVGRSDWLPDGSFDTLRAAGFVDLNREAEVDPSEGAQAPGSLKLTAPWNSRYHIHLDREFDPSLPLFFKAKFRGNASSDTRLSFNAAFFGGNQWLGTWSAATLGKETISSPELRGKGTIVPPLNQSWQTVEAMLPGASIQFTKDIRVIFFLDIRGGKPGDIIRIDDIELYQPQQGGF